LRKQDIEVLGSSEEEQVAMAIQASTVGRDDKVMLQISIQNLISSERLVSFNFRDGCYSFQILTTRMLSSLKTSQDQRTLLKNWVSEFLNAGPAEENRWSRDLDDEDLSKLIAVLLEQDDLILNA
jgi:hypothetical protein